MAGDAGSTVTLFLLGLFAIVVGLIVFFSLAKQAFGNYYFLSIAAYCLCVASSEVS